MSHSEPAEEEEHDLGPELFDVRDTACPYFSEVQLWIMFSKFGDIRLLCWFLTDEGVCEHDGSRSKLKDGMCPLVKRLGVMKKQ